jgi:hypothetical protein
MGENPIQFISVIWLVCSCIFFILQARKYKARYKRLLDQLTKLKDENKISDSDYCAIIVTLTKS